jgi:hypothetical protein
MWNPTLHRFFARDSLGEEAGQRRREEGDFQSGLVDFAIPTFHGEPDLFFWRKGGRECV